MRSTYQDKETASRIRTLSKVMLLCFICVAIALAYWSVIRGPSILERDDNPRRIQAELRLRRGRILDSSGDVLAESVGPVDDLRRIYPTTSAGPAVGYYSIRHGTSGIEASYDTLLRGESGEFWQDFWRYQVLHETREGRDVRLTLDGRWQRAADTLLGEEKGAILLFSLPDLAIRSMVSHPSYDPNTLDESFEELTSKESASLLNRVTQGQYQPGLLLSPFVFSAAIDRGILEINDLVDGPLDPVFVNGNTLNCQGPLPDPPTWADVLRQGCPGPISTLAELLGEAGLSESFSAFGFLEEPTLPIATKAVGEHRINDLALAGIGQENLVVSPLQMGLALAALAQEGERGSPSIVLSTQNQDGEWELELAANEPFGAVSPESARAIVEALPVVDGIREYSVLVLSGPDGETNAWYLGLAPAGDPRFAVVVVVENTYEVGAAEQAGRSLLRNVLNPVEGS
jgi:peptidoglycan glycosyltransferase